MDRRSAIQIGAAALAVCGIHPQWEAVEISHFNVEDQRIYLTNGDSVALDEVYPNTTPNPTPTGPQRPRYRDSPNDRVAKEERVQHSSC